MTTNNIEPTGTTCNPACDTSPCTVEVAQDTRGTTINAGMHLTVKLTGNTTPPPPEYQPGAGGAFVGQWLFMRQDPLPSGYVALDGTLYTNAAAKLPDLVAYLATRENECTTEADWQARSAAASGTGGVPFYVLDNSADTLRMPDTRGDSPYHGTAGTWEGDAIRNIDGYLDTIAYGTAPGASSGNPPWGGAFAVTRLGYGTSSSVKQASFRYQFDSKNVVPTDTTNHPRRIGLTWAVYAGTIGA